MCLVAAQLIQSICVLAPNGDMAFAVGTLALTYFNLTLGYYIRLCDLLCAIAVVSWFNPLRHAYASALQARWASIHHQPRIFTTGASWFRVDSSGDPIHREFAIQCSFVHNQSLYYWASFR